MEHLELAYRALSAAQKCRQLGHHATANALMGIVDVMQDLPSLDEMTQESKTAAFEKLLGGFNHS